MKICHISTTFIHKAGSTRRTFAILRALVNNGYDVVHIVGREYAPDPAWDLSGIELERIDTLVKYTKPASDISSLRTIYGLLRKHQPDLVHTHLAKAGIIGRLAARLAMVPYVVHTVHGPTFASNLHLTKRTFYRSLERFCSHFTDYFVFVGEELRSEYVRCGVGTEDSSVVIRTGRPTSDFDNMDKVAPEEISRLRVELGGTESAFLIGCIGRLVPSKAQDKAIKVLSLVREKGVDAHLILVGTGLLGEEKEYESELRKLASHLGLSDYVHFAGFRTDVLICMKAMDVLVMTSKYEGLPNIAVEAGIVRRPLVAFDVCGIHEVIRDSVTGYILEQDDIAGMADRLSILAKNSDAVSLGEKARGRVKALYNIDRTVMEKMEFYEKILRPSK